MARRVNPLARVAKLFNEDGTATPEFLRQWQLIRQKTEGSDADIAALVLAVAALENAELTAESGELTGGGLLKNAPLSFGLANSGVTPDTYGDATNVPQVTVDAFGRVTNIVDVPISGGSGGATVNWAAQPTPPESADFTLVKGGGTTGALSDITRGMALSITGAGAVDRNGFAEVAAPGATWQMDALLVPNFVARRFMSFGLGVRDSATGRIQTFAFGVVGTGVTVPQFRDSRWSAIDTFSAGVNGIAVVMSIAPIWVRVVCGVTNLNVYVSVDGENYELHYTVAKNIYVANIDRVGVFLGVNQTDGVQNQPAALSVMGFTVV